MQFYIEGLLEEAELTGSLRMGRAYRCTQTSKYWQNKPRKKYSIHPFMSSAGSLKLLLCSDTAGISDWTRFLPSRDSKSRQVIHEGPKAECRPLAALRVLPEQSQKHQVRSGVGTGQGWGGGKLLRPDMERWREGGRERKERGESTPKGGHGIHTAVSIYVTLRAEHKGCTMWSQHLCRLLPNHVVRHLHAEETRKSKPRISILLALREATLSTV